MASEFIVRKGLKSLGGITYPLTAVSDTYTIGVDDYFIECTTNTFTVTLPTAVGVNGKQYIIKNVGTGLITVGTTSSQTIDGTLTKTLSQNESIEVVSNNSNWKIVGGVGTNVVNTDLKSGVVSNTSFTGAPYNYVVNLSVSFPNTNYSVAVMGGDARSWTVESLTTSSFVINTNSNTALTSSVYWIANSNS